MTNLFAFPSLYDESLADGGEWFPVIVNDLSWGEYRCKLIDNTMPHHKIAKERLDRQYNQAAKRGEKRTEDDKLIDLFLEISLTDWRKVPGHNGDVPYSRENAHALFKSRYGPVVFEQLLVKATDRANYQADTVEDGDETPTKADMEKNS